MEIQIKNPKNKIFVVNKDIPDDNKIELNEKINDNNEKKYFKSDRLCKTSKNLDIYNIESNTVQKVIRQKLSKMTIIIMRII